ncbi:Oidioi.mRNA.OKI2018_I69.chr1.g2430.t1.cds [Oikopleura dioica]|uniref:Oidioi.mRNA.OKI2018_I69.chr1.g2430.t1.cds n=1 Tax=Oikopleura dioica TaxID=34765 RepID=A0ABN7SXG1_OIKDI|nr:Oidioi.mRNA.OKI2018_I69.chr1.g2430.t1.cds [Oikopleura dioica]
MNAGPSKRNIRIERKKPEILKKRPAPEVPKRPKPEIPKRPKLRVPEIPETQKLTAHPSKNLIRSQSSIGALLHKEELKKNIERFQKGGNIRETAPKEEIVRSTSSFRSARTFWEENQKK